MIDLTLLSISENGNVNRMNKYTFPELFNLFKIRSKEILDYVNTFVYNGDNIDRHKMLMAKVNTELKLITDNIEETSEALGEEDDELKEMYEEDRLVVLYENMQATYVPFLSALTECTPDILEFIANNITELEPVLGLEYESDIDTGDKYGNLAIKLVSFVDFVRTVIDTSDSIELSISILALMFQVIRPNIVSKIVVPI